MKKFTKNKMDVTRMTAKQRKQMLTNLPILFGMPKENNTTNICSDTKKEIESIKKCFI